MSEHLVTDLALRLNGPWTIPVLGVAVALLSFLGIRLFVGAKPRTDVLLPKAPASGPVDPFLEGSQRERRIAPRRGGGQVDVELADPDEVLPPMSGWVVDRSVGGLRLSVECPITEGKQLRVQARGPAARWVSIEVRSCHPRGDHWELGCQFLKTPSWDVLLTFG
jgi:hypothetical protein